MDKIDIYLYSPSNGSNNLPIHAWIGVPAGQQSYEVKLAPKWWNATGLVDLSLNIVPTGNQPWDTSNPFGPTWSALYHAPTDGSSPPSDAVVGSDDSNSLVQAFYAGGHLTDGGKAAAIICPLIVFFVAIGIWIRKLHLNRNNKTADWAEHMDQRMSRISLDWMAGGDGSAGPVPGSRPASFMRPQSQYRPSAEMHNAALREAAAATAGAAGVGAGAGVYPGSDPEHQTYDEVFGDESGDQMREAVPRRPFSTATGFDSQNRTSRISFADTTAGDRVSRISYGPSDGNHSAAGAQAAAAAARGHRSSASLPRNNNGNNNRRSQAADSYIDPDAPAVPKLDISAYHNRNKSSATAATSSAGAHGVGNNNAGSSRLRESFFPSADDEPEQMDDADEYADVLSPTQHQGAKPFSNDDIDRHIADQTDVDFRNSVLQYPALSMVTGNAAEEGDQPDLFAAMTGQQHTARPLSGLSDGGDSAYAPNERGASAYIDHSHYAAGAHAMSADHPARMQQQLQPQTQPLQQQQPQQQQQQLGNNTGMLPPSNSNSPDEALKQYAALRAAGSASTGPNMMRTLYTADVTPAAPSPSTSSNSNAKAARRGSSIYIDASGHLGGHQAQQGSAATGGGSSINEDDVVGYNEMIHHGASANAPRNVL